ncbi:tyrosine-type recombinase/integrase [Streptomyces sp. IBSBF 2435]|uniref:tyrosine-type recombinase/integrase n=1 Tax=Streptomyces sp. IBSBF 2435 TaxID=2903531 RepID=UPI003FA74C8D
MFTGPRGGRITTAVLRDPTHWDDVVRELGHEHLRRHDLRHTGLTWMADAGIPLHVLRLIAGHGSLHTIQRYLHPDLHSAMNAGNTLGTHLTPKPGLPPPPPNHGRTPSSVADSLLGVHLLGGDAESLIGIDTASPPAYAEADLKSEGVSLEDDREHDGIAQVGHPVLGLPDAEAVGKSGKFVAAQPGHSLAFADGAGDASGQLDEGGVASPGPSVSGPEPRPAGRTGGR